jgi:hypothetical protein
VITISSFCDAKLSKIWVDISEGKAPFRGEYLGDFEYVICKNSYFSCTDGIVIEAIIIAEQRGHIGRVEEEEYIENEQLRAAFLKRMKRFEMVPIQVFNHQPRQIGQIRTIIAPESLFCVLHNHRVPLYI